jgi:hypothetical protein
MRLPWYSRAPAVVIAASIAAAAAAAVRGGGRGGGRPHYKFNLTNGSENLETMEYMRCGRVYHARPDGNIVKADSASGVERESRAMIKCDARKRKGSWCGRRAGREEEEDMGGEAKAG